MVNIILFCVVLLSVTTDIIQGRCIKDDDVQLPDGITLHKVVGTWEEALLQCQTEGAVIASPINSKLLNAMKSLIAVRNTAYLLGTRTYYNNSGSFVSLEGIALDCMTSAVVNMIETLDPWDGDCLAMDEHSIRAVPCSLRLPYMCYQAQIEYNVTRSPTTEQTTVKETTELQDSLTTKIPEQDTTEPITEHESTDVNGYFIIPATRKCSTGYTAKASTGKCYRLNRFDRYTWDQAEATCVAEGAHLAVIDDTIEAQEIADITPLNSIVFLGLRYDDNYGWRSIDGRPLNELYNEWNTDDYLNRLDLKCAAIYGGKLDNFDCDIVYHFLCEKAPVPV